MPIPCDRYKALSLNIHKSLRFRVPSFDWLTWSADRDREGGDVAANQATRSDNGLAPDGDAG